MRVIDYSRHLNQKQWQDMALQTGKSTAELALTDVNKIRAEVKLWIQTQQPVGGYWYRFYRELLRALGGHEWHGPP